MTWRVSAEELLATFFLRGVPMKEFVLRASLAFAIVSTTASAGLTGEIWSRLKTNPLKIPTVDTAVTTLKGVTCVEIVFGMGEPEVTRVTAPVDVWPQAILEASIRIDRLAEQLFLAFDGPVRRMAVKVYEEQDLVSYLPDLTGTSESGFAETRVEGRRRMAPVVHLHSALQNSIVYKRLVLLHEALRLGLWRTGMSYPNVIDHYPEDEDAGVASPQEYVKELRHFLFLVDKALVDQIPIGYFEADIKLRVPAGSLRTAFLDDVKNLQATPLEGLLVHPLYRAQNRGASDAEAVRVMTWLSSVSLPRDAIED